MQLDAFPKAAVDVYVCILEADGGELAAAITAGAAALADAGIPMRDLVAACSFVSCLNWSKASSGAAFVLEPQAPQQLSSLNASNILVLALLAGAVEGRWSWTPTVGSSPSRKLEAHAAII